ncbi:MAG: reverse transcriptase family protein [Bacteroidota bacterium]
MSSLRTLKRRRDTFVRIRTPRDLAALLEYPAHKLQLLSMEPRYHTFQLPKADGSKRLIENPEPSLKYIQRRLNNYLQSTYYFVCTDAAYGFIRSRRREPDPRNILTHAQQHLGCQWLINIDIEDFFHRVSFQKVWEIFTQPPFDFNDELAQLLTRLCTWKERLPMGAPSSPALSNFSCMAMDEDLLSLASWGGWKFTRFVDDMSFSSAEEIDYQAVGKIVQTVENHGYELNPEKFKRMGPEDTKIVTGLRVGENVIRLQEEFLPRLRKSIYKLGHVLDVQSQANARHTEWVEDFQDQIEGMLTFASFVLGEEAPEIQEIEEELDHALVPDPKFSTQSWLSFAQYV